MAKKLDIFRPGRFVASDGRTLTFSEADVRASAEAYDPALHEAPLCVGHPAANMPAYGWVGAAEFADGTLRVEPAQVDPAFAEMVNAGRFKKISASFYAPDSPSNPQPGVYYLRHVGFLGAQPPAVSGLRSAEFAAGDEGFVEFAELPWWYHRNVASMFRRLRDWIISTSGLEKANEVLPEWEVENLSAEAAKAEPAPAQSAAFAEPVATASIIALTNEERAELERLRAAESARQADFAESQRRATEQAAATRTAGIVEFCEQLVTQGRLLPKDRAGTIALLASLPDHTEIEFAEGESQVKVNKPAADWLRAFLAAAPVQVDFAERGAPKPGDELNLHDADAISKRAIEFQASEQEAGRTVTIAAAVHHVTRGAAI